MYDRDKMKELLTERDKLGLYDEYQTEEIWRKIMCLLTSRADLDGLAEYMKSEMTYDEFRTIGEIIDEINPEHVARKFIEALKMLIEKYLRKCPAEWQKDQIENVMLEVFEEELNNRERRSN